MTPVTFTWDGEVMKPLPHLTKLCDRQFVVGENYRLEVVQHRSAESHRHYFAAINEAWNNLPEVHEGRWPTPDHLRKWALIKSGFRNEVTYIAGSKAEAQRFASFTRSLDEYAVIHVTDRMVAIYTAKSQSLKSMTAKEFQASKQAVLDALAEMIGVSAKDFSGSDTNTRSVPDKQRESA